MLGERGAVTTKMLSHGRSLTGAVLGAKRVRQQPPVAPSAGPVASLSCCFSAESASLKHLEAVYTSGLTAGSKCSI